MKGESITLRWVKLSLHLLNVHNNPRETHSTATWMNMDRSSSEICLSLLQSGFLEGIAQYTWYRMCRKFSHFLHSAGRSNSRIPQTQFWKWRQSSRLQVWFNTQVGLQATIYTKILWNCCSRLQNTAIIHDGRRTRRDYTWYFHQRTVDQKNLTMESSTIEVVSNASVHLFRDDTLSSFRIFLPELLNLEGQWQFA